jgi:hypothetical protein
MAWGPLGLFAANSRPTCLDARFRLLMHSAESRGLWGYWLSGLVAAKRMKHGQPRCDAMRRTILDIEAGGNFNIHHPR